MDNFYIVCMKCKNNKKCYLSVGNILNTYVWKFNIREAIWFDTETEAEKFAKKYFKKFKDWFVIEIQ